jgi:hypothetical protein
VHAQGDVVTVDFDVIAESLRCTNLGALAVGDKVRRTNRE